MSFDCVETGSGSPPSSPGRAAGFPTSLEGPDCSCEKDSGTVRGSRKLWLGSNCCALRYLGSESVGGRVDGSKKRSLHNDKWHHLTYTVRALTVLSHLLRGMKLDWRSEV